MAVRRAPRSSEDPLDIPPAPQKLHFTAKAPEPPVPPLKRTPPLFIKIDKYTEIVKNIQRLKSYSLSLRDALDALAEIESELKTGLDVTQKALDRFNTIIALLDAKLLRIQGIDTEPIAEEAENVENYMDKLSSQMERLKSELKSLS